jgi:uncharacterized protein
MEPRIHVITLAVSDLERALAFYCDGLGLQTPGVIGTEFVDDETGASGTVAMFDLHGGLILALYPDLEKDAGIPPAAQSEWFQSRSPRSEQGRRRLFARASRGGRGDADRHAVRTALGHLLGLLPRPRQPPVGGDLEPAAGERGGLGVGSHRVADRLLKESAGRTIRCY